MEIRVPDIFRAALDFAFPQICPGCESYLETEEAVCAQCIKSFFFMEGPLCFNCRGRLDLNSAKKCCSRKTLPLILYAEYKTSIQESIISMKFRAVKKLIPFFAGALVEKWGETIKELDADRLVPVPLHSSREFARGYNQSELLADHIGEALGIGVDSDIVMRSRKRRVQSTLPMEKRKANVRGAFSIKEVPVDVKRVIIVDDVMTSGATLTEVKLTLTNAGLTVVGIIAVAYAGSDI